MAEQYMQAERLLSILQIDGEDGDWRRKAACRGKSRIVRFYPPITHRGGGRVRNWDQEAREICSECPVNSLDDGPCFNQAMILQEQGIWAGTDDGERMTLRAYMNVEAGRKVYGKTTLRRRPGLCPDCGGRWSVHINSSTGDAGDPTEVKCLECNLRWKDPESILDSEAQRVVG